MILKYNDSRLLILSTSILSHLALGLTSNASRLSGAESPRLTAIHLVCIFLRQVAGVRCQLASHLVCLLYVVRLAVKLALLRRIERCIGLYGIASLIGSGDRLGLGGYAAFRRLLATDGARLAAVEEAGVFFGDRLWGGFELAADLCGSVFDVTLFGNLGLQLSRGRAWDVSASILISST